MPRISRPVAASERIAVSRPDPGPFTYTSTRVSPCSGARRAAASAASCAANGVDFREPLNPTFPALAHESVFPSRSVIVTIVLLNVDLMWAWPCATFFFSFRRGFFAFGFAMWLRRLSPHTDGLLGTFPGPRVRVGPLSPHREVPAVPDPLVRADLDLPLDVLGDVPPKVPLDLIVAVDPLPDLDHLFLGQVADLAAAVDVRSPHGRQRPGRPDPVDVAKSHVHPLVAGEVDACDPSHPRPLLPLSLLVRGVLGADHHDPPVPADDLALVTHLLHRRSNLHLRRTPRPYRYRYTIRPLVRSYGDSSTRTRSPGRIRM